MIKKIIILSLVSSMSLSFYATGQAPPPSTEPSNNTDEEMENFFEIGLISFGFTSPYVGGKSRVEVLPYFEFQYGPLFFFMGNLGTFIYGSDNWGVAAAVNFDLMGDAKRGESAELADMEKLNEVITGSLLFFYEASWGEINAQLSTDTSNHHQGHTANLEYGYTLEFNDWRITPTIGAQWFNAEVSTYLAGVSEKDARVDRPFYQPGSGVNFTLALMAEYQINENNRMMFNLMNQTYSSEVTDSPIIDKANNLSIGVGYLYRF